MTPRKSGLRRVTGNQRNGDRQPGLRTGRGPGIDKQKQGLTDRKPKKYRNQNRLLTRKHIDPGLRMPDP